MTTTKEGAEIWKALTDEEKLPWMKMAEEEKKREQREKQEYE